jgi:hypothetical protein
LKEEDIDSIVRTNLTSMMLGTKFLLRYVVESILVALAPVLMWMCVDLLPV